VRTKAAPLVRAGGSTATDGRAMFNGLWLAFKRNCPSAGASLNQIIAVNLPLCLFVVVIGAIGRYWASS
jgi:hypothetical protein